jgi:hypothetical protein
MSQPRWQTQAGSLGTYPAGIPISIQLVAFPEVPATLVSYTLLSGELPSGTLKLSYTGMLSGIPENISTEKTATFTVRAKDDLNNIRDRTFTLTVSGSNRPRFTVPSGELLHIRDSEYVEYHMHYSNPISDNKVTVTVSSGSLPPGLYMDAAGIIKGYPEMPILGDHSPTTKTYTFSTQLRSELGDDLNVYAITVVNQQLRNPPNTRLPVILNKHPLNEPIPKDDLFYDYYLLNGRKISTIRANEQFSFKIIGYDFDRNDIIYQFGDLPHGLVGDTKTGWITGSPILPDNSIKSYDVSVSVAKKNVTSIASQHEIFTILVTNNVPEDIVWVTDSNLGTIFNGTVSSLVLEATSTLDLVYRITEGSLPPNLVLLDTGEIVGRVAEQPTEYILPEGTDTTYTFTVEALNPNNPALSKFQTFTLVVNQYYPEPLENVYFKAASSIEQKRSLNSLLTNESIIPTEMLYRPQDPYYGKAKDVRIIQAYGIRSSTVDDYINAVRKNHYQRSIVLGEIQTAVATDSKGNILYEVVYSKVVDDLVNDKGVSVTKTITWPRPINLRLGPWNVNNSTIKVSNSLLNTNLSPGNTQTLNSGSLENMRKELTANIGQNVDSRLLPLWMVTQQNNSSTLGFVLAWVICYTKPGMSATIKTNIETMWGHSLNEIDFTIDRYIVDKSATYNWNTNLAVPTWNSLPSGVPVPDPFDSKDIVVLFPRKTILPKEIE